MRKSAPVAIKDSPRDGAMRRDAVQMSSWTRDTKLKSLMWVPAVLMVALASACSVETGPRESTAPTTQPVTAPTRVAPPAGTGVAARSSSAAAPTNVIVYYPVAPGGDAQDGSCWTNSLTILSRDAWRCNVGGQILDPCFDLGNGEVVCSPNPLAGQPGVLIKLSDPLPAPNLIVERSSNPWLLELGDGSICKLATGATGLLDGKRISYLCSAPGSKATERTVVLGSPTPGTVWEAETAVMVTQDGKPVATSSSTVPLRAVVKGPAQRVLFEPNTTSASFQRTVQKGDSQDFILWAFSGQTMIVDATTSRGKVALSIVGRSTGGELMSGGSTSHWQGRLPATQDYRIRVAALEDAAEYQLDVTIPATLQVPTKDQPTTVKGRVKPGQKVLYLFPGAAGQRIAVSVTSPGGKALLAMHGLEDGAYLVPAMARTTSWAGALPREQDYVIEVGSEGAASDFTLQIAAP